MKNYIISLMGVILLSSCDPYGAGEGIDLPTMEFKINVNPDSAYLKIGDTIRLFSSISSILSNGVKIEDGKAYIDLYMGYTSQIPITEFGFHTVEENNHTKIMLNKGGIKIHPSTGNIVEIYAMPYDDSIQVDISFVPLKTGTYTFYIQPLFYEGSQGKTRTQPVFDKMNQHFDELWKLDKSDINYDKQYLFAVYE